MWPMNTSGNAACHRAGCDNAIPLGLASEQMCLNHFLDEAFLRAEQSLDSCCHGLPMNSSNLEWLLSDALAIVKNLEEGADQPNPEQRDRMLELLLILANLHEYVAHHAVHLQRLA